MSLKDDDRNANSVDPDQTAPLSGSALFAKICPPKNIGSLRYSFLLCQFVRFSLFITLLIITWFFVITLPGLGSQMVIFQ